MTAVSNGCDMLQQSIKSLEQSTPRGGERYAALNRELANANETVTGLTHTCAFMSMIINRCIDYTKASHGLPITPTM